MLNKLFTAAVLCAAAGQAQTQVHPNPDCQFFFTLTAANQFLPAASGFDNRQQGCTTWNMSYVNSGFTGLTVTLETAANNAGSAGSFSAGFAIQENTISGSNAATDTTGGFWWAQGLNAWVHVKLSGTTGSGVVQGAVYGWRIPNAGGTAGGGGGITCLTGDVAAGSGSGCTTATVQGIESVPFCSGYTPGNGEFVKYTTGGTPDPCYSAAVPAGGGTIESTTNALVGDGAGNAVAAGGTGTNCLLVNGGNQACGGGGSSGFTLLEEHTAANSSQLAFTTCITSTYDTYQIQFVSLLPATNNVAIVIQVSTDGGSTYDTGSNYSWQGFRASATGSAAAGNNGDIGFNLTAGGTQTNTSTNGGFVGSVNFYSPLNGAFHPRMAGNLAANDGTTAPEVGEFFSASYLSTTAVNAFRVKADNGNLTSGSVRCYGLSK